MSVTWLDSTNERAEFLPMKKKTYCSTDSVDICMVYDVEKQNGLEIFNITLITILMDNLVEKCWFNELRMGRGSFRYGVKMLIGIKKNPTRFPKESLCEQCHSRHT